MTCPVAWSDLVDYWAGDLDPARADALEAHLMGCAACSAASARVAAVTEALRQMIGVALTNDGLARLRARGLRIVENRLTAGEARTVRFPADADLLIHHLAADELTRAERVRLTIRDQTSGRPLAEVDDAPFERATATVLVACQQHYAAFSHDTVAELRIRDADGRETLRTYTILHIFEAASS